MITQKIIARTDSLKLDKILSRYGEASMRQVVFIIVRPDPDSEELIPITIPEDAVGSVRILKPSGNFIIVPMNKSVLSTGETAFDVVIPASANTAKGSGYYDIRITSDTDKYYYTAQGDFIIDDNIISDEVLEDVSEVNGLIFPDDFLTTDDHFAQINDEIISPNYTWSSDKINTLGFKGLDYDNIIDLTLPNKTGYDYTLPANGIIIVSAYGSCAYTEITFNNIPFRIYHASDTWSSGTCIVNSGVVHFAMGATGGTYPVGSYLKFIPFKN